MTVENMEEIMVKEENKFIFYFDPEKIDQEFIKQINTHAEKMRMGLNCSCYFIDTSKYGKDFFEYIKKRNMSKEMEDQIEKNTFILSNRNDDVSLRCNV
jgi:hypothetical protein